MSPISPPPLRVLFETAENEAKPDNEEKAETLDLFAFPFPFFSFSWGVQCLCIRIITVIYSGAGRASRIKYTRCKHQERKEMKK
jgi:hypothetical protein